MRAASNGGSKPRLLDLFCGAGGAAMGYHRAGFEVVGVDIEPQPNYPFEFHQAEALDFGWQLLSEGSMEAFDTIHASPPCQAYTVHNGARKDHPDLIGPTREALRATGLPYVIENVPGAPLLDAFTLCGSSFGLGVHLVEEEPVLDAEWRQLRRHREFEINWPLMTLIPPCAHEGLTVGIYGDHFRLGRRSNLGEYSGQRAVAMSSAALGIDWMQTWEELREAIPPAYTEFIGEQLMAHLKTQVAA